MECTTFFSSMCFGRGSWWCNRRFHHHCWENQPSRGLPFPLLFQEVYTPVFYTPVIHTPAKLYSRILYVFGILNQQPFTAFFAFQPSAISAKALKSPDSDCIPIQSVCFAARNELSAKSAARRCHRQSFEPEALREARPGGPLINRIHSENNHVRHKHVSATYDLFRVSPSIPPQWNGKQLGEAPLQPEKKAR